MAIDTATSVPESASLAPPVAPFDAAAVLSCNKCASRVTRWCRLIAWFKGMQAVCMNTAYCEGSKQPSEMLSGMAAVMTGQSERINPCVGVFFPHLHLTCRNCGALLLMETKDARKEAR